MVINTVPEVSTDALETQKSGKPRETKNTVFQKSWQMPQKQKTKNNKTRQPKKNVTPGGSGAAKTFKILDCFKLFFCCDVWFPFFLLGDHHAGVQPTVSEMFFKYILVKDSLVWYWMDGNRHVRAPANSGWKCHWNENDVINVIQSIMSLTMFFLNYAEEIALVWAPQVLFHFWRSKFWN